MGGAGGGGIGGNGGTGADGCGNPGPGQNGTAGNGGATGGNGTDVGSGGGCCGDATPAAGGSGGNGTNGTGFIPGDRPASPTPSGGFFTPGSQSASGGNGFGGGGGGGGGGSRGGTCVCIDCAGNNGGRGGNGGNGGLGGTGAYGGGASFGVYIFGTSGGSFIDCNIAAGSTGTGGTGGSGQAATGGAAGASGANNGSCVCGNPSGANGGSGGNGGGGGRGRDGANGLASNIYVEGTAPAFVLSGSNIPLVAGNNNPAGFALSAQPVITAQNISCVYTDVDFSASFAGSWNLGTGASTPVQFGSPVTTQYNLLGRKDIIYGVNLYTGFFYIAIDDTAFSPDIITNANLLGQDTFYVCQGDAASFSTSVTAVTYAWNMGGATMPNTYNQQVIPNQPMNTAGVFNIVLRVETDCCGWSNPDSIVLIVEPFSAVIVLGPAQICVGESAVLIATGAAQYSWVPQAGLSSDTGQIVTATPNVTTTYYITGTSQQGLCNATTSFTLTVQNPIELSFTTIPATCSGNGSATVSVAGGSGVYKYEWGTNPLQITPTASNLQAASYTVTVTDLTTGCVADSSVFVGAPGAFIGYVSNVNNAGCPGSVGGGIWLGTLGGTPPVTYNWSNGPITDSIINLSPGFYSVTMTDANACVFLIDSIEITGPPPLFLNLIDSTAGCSGSPTGSITVSGNGGIGPVSYVWSTVPPQFDSVAVNLLPGIYTVTAIALDSCPVSLTIPLSGNPPVSASATSTNPACNGAIDGTITISASGGNPPFQYSIDSLNFQPSNQFSNLGSGTYLVVVLDSSGCDTTFNVVLVDPPPIAVSILNIDSVSCFGLNDGSIQATVTGGVGPFSYSLDGINFQPAGTFSNLVAGTYTLSVQNGNGCTDSISGVVAQPSQLNLVLDSANINCAGSSSGMVSILNITGGAHRPMYMSGTPEIPFPPFQV